MGSILGRASIAAIGLALTACGSQSTDDTSPPAEPVTTQELGSGSGSGAPQANKHLRVLVSYENGVFQVEKVTEVNAPLRAGRGRRSRSGFHYSARGKTNFVGNAVDPRTLHVEAEDPATGTLEHREARAPGKQYFRVYVPEGTDLVDFLDELPTPGAAFRTAQAPLGTIDLRKRP